MATNNTAFKYEWLRKVCELCDEYRELGGLEDAKRASDIPNEIIEIIENIK